MKPRTTSPARLGLGVPAGRPGHSIGAEDEQRDGVEPAPVHEDRRPPIEESLDGAAPQGELGVPAELDARREVHAPGEPRTHLMAVAALHVETPTRLDDPEMVVDGLESDDGRRIPGGGVAKRHGEHDEQRERRRETRERQSRSKRARSGGTGRRRRRPPRGETPLEPERRRILRKAPIERLAQALLRGVLARAVRAAVEVRPHRLVLRRDEQTALVVEQAEAGLVAARAHGA